MKVLTRYLLKSHIGPLIFAFVALTGVILINTLARSLADLGYGEVESVRTGRTFHLEVEGDDGLRGGHRRSIGHRAPTTGFSSAPIPST